MMSTRITTLDEKSPSVYLTLPFKSKKEMKTNSTTTKTTATTATNIKTTPTDIRSNTILPQNIEPKHSWKCESTCVATRTDIDVTHPGIEVIPFNTRIYSIDHRINAHQQSLQPHLTLHQWQLTSMQRLTTSAESTPSSNKHVATFIH